MARDDVVVVTGATGRQGGAVTRALLRDGWRVRAVTRHPDGAAARRLSDLGADVVRADLREPSALGSVLAGAYGVYSVQNPMISGLDGEVVQGRNVAEAARAAGVRHVVYGSAGVGVPGTGVGSWESKLAVEAHMRDLGLPVTVLRPMAFMELMSDRAFYPPVSTWYLMPKLMGEDRPVPWVSVEDLGAIAAIVFANPERYVGGELRLAADVRSLRECRDIWRTATGHRPRALPIPQWLFRRFVGDDLLTMWRWLRTGVVDVDPAETRQLLPEALTVQAWVRRHLSRR